MDKEKSDITYYLVTDDVNNFTIVNLVERLKRLTVGKVVLLTPNYVRYNNFNLIQVFFDCENKSLFDVFFWSKICFFFSKAYSLNDRNYHTRSTVVSNVIARFVATFISKLMRIKFVNDHLPTYESMLFLPIFPSKTKYDPNSIFIFDSILLRSLKYISFIKAIKSNYTVWNFVSSFDNPFYSQFSQNASLYFVWSEEMIIDIHKNQHVADCNSQFKVIGPYPFDDVAHTKRKDLFSLNNSIYVGYACAFPDPVLQAAEVEFIIKLSKRLKQHGFKLLVKPYPSLPLDSYSLLKIDQRNIEMYDSKLIAVDRYGDSREIIRFSTLDDKLGFLERCQCFVSLATSFSIEAALFGIPIYHLFLNKENRVERFEKILFENISIKDHILKYFNGHLETCFSYDELELTLLSSKDTKDQNLFFLKKLGF